MLDTLTFDAGTHLKHEDIAAKNGQFDVTLAKRCMAKWTLSLNADASGLPPKVEDHRRFYAKAVLAEVRPEAPLRAPYTLPADLLAKATGAYVRVVTDDVQRWEGALTVGETTYPLPPSRSAGAVIQEIRVRVADLRATGELTFNVTSPATSNGYSVRSAAVELVVPGGQR